MENSFNDNAEDTSRTFPVCNCGEPWTHSNNAQASVMIRPNEDHPRTIPMPRNGSYVGPAVVDRCPSPRFYTSQLKPARTAKAGSSGTKTSHSIGTWRSPYGSNNSAPRDKTVDHRGEAIAGKKKDGK